MCSSLVGGGAKRSSTALGDRDLRPCSPEEGWGEGVSWATSSAEQCRSKTLVMNHPRASGCIEIPVWDSARSSHCKPSASCSATSLGTGYRRYGRDSDAYVCRPWQVFEHMQPWYKGTVGNREARRSLRACADILLLSACVGGGDLASLCAHISDSINSQATRVPHSKHSVHKHT